MLKDEIENDKLIKCKPKQIINLIPNQPNVEG
jgi:hypothetical protein